MRQLPCSTDITQCVLQPRHLASKRRQLLDSLLLEVSRQLVKVEHPEVGPWMLQSSLEVQRRNKDAFIIEHCLLVEGHVKVVVDVLL